MESVVAGAVSGTATCDNRTGPRITRSASSFFSCLRFLGDLWDLAWDVIAEDGYQNFKGTCVGTKKCRVWSSFEKNGVKILDTHAGNWENEGY